MLRVKYKLHSCIVVTVLDFKLTNWREQHRLIALEPQIVQMAFAPRGSKGPGRSPKQSPYQTASASSHKPSSRAKTCLSFETPPGKACDDACSVRSSCGSDSRNTFKPSSTSWYVITHTTQLVCSVTDSQGTESACTCRRGDDLATAGSQTPGTSHAIPHAHGNLSGMHLIHEHTSYSQDDGLVTPAPKEGQRFRSNLQLESTSSQVCNYHTKTCCC